MGQKSAFETFVGLQSAFLSRHEWQQKELAKLCEVRPHTVKKVLELFREKGVYALKSETRDRLVHWSIPKGAIAGGILVPNHLAEAAFRIVARSSKSKEQKELLSLFDRTLSEKSKSVTSPDQIVAVAQSRLEEEMLGAVEAAAAQRRPLAISYVSQREGLEPSNRMVSVYRLVHGSALRFVGWCHRDSTLRWYRVDGLRRARQDFNVKLHPEPTEELEAYLFESIDGYHGGGVREDYAFFVRDPDARWVMNSLPKPMKATRTNDGIEVTITTSALIQVARFVLGLGGAAQIHTPKLREATRELAEAFLANHR